MGQTPLAVVQGVVSDGVALKTIFTNQARFEARSIGRNIDMATREEKIMAALYLVGNTDNENHNKAREKQFGKP